MADGRVGFVTHASSLAHDAGPRHPESAERIHSIIDHLDGCALTARLEHHQPDPATHDEIGLTHDATLIELLQRLDQAGGGRIDLDTAMGPSSLEATLRASRGAIDAAERVVDNQWDAAFVCMRPPGHHATRFRPMGFCLTNHVAVAARWAIATGRANHVLIVDWDAHHGNGTEDIFWTEECVLYVSLHQYPWYPGTGDATDVGEGAGRGYTLNIPLPAASAEDAYDAAFTALVEPAAAAFGPDLVFVSAGFDAHAADPLCMMRLTAGAFFRMARRVSPLGPGPICVLEGGYDLDALAWSSAAMTSALLGDDAPTGVPQAELGSVSGDPGAVEWVGRTAQLRRRLELQP